MSIESDIDDLRHGLCELWLMCILIALCLVANGCEISADFEPPVKTERFTDAEERHLDTLNSLAAMEVLRIATAPDPTTYDAEYKARVEAAYEWACDNTSYLNGQKTYTEAELFGGDKK